MQLRTIHMEVLLLQDVKGIGKKNDLIAVGDGYALNCLLPTRVALVATPLVRRHYADSIRKRAEERENERQLQAGVVSMLAGKTVRLSRRTTKAGKLYAAISEDLIVDAIKTQLSVDVPLQSLQVPDHIKSVGSYPVQVKIGDAVATVTVVVEAEAAKVSA